MQNNRLKELRETLGYTIIQIAQATNMTRSRYSKLEKNKIPNASMISYIKLADFYGVGLDYLLGRNTQPTINKNIVTYDIIKDINKFNKINFNEPDTDNIEEITEIKKVETKILQDIIKKENLIHTGYPINILNAIFDQNILKTEIEIVPTIIKDLELIYNEYLTEREIYVIKMRFIKQLTLETVGTLLNVGRERIRQIESIAIRKLRRGYITNSLVYKIDDDIENKKQELNKLKNEIEKYNNKIQTRRIVTKPIHICELNFSIRTTNSLIRANIDTLEKLVKYTLNNEILKTRSLGKKSYFEILNKLQDMKIIKYDNNIDNVNNVIHSIRLIRRPFVFVKIP